MPYPEEKETFDRRVGKDLSQGIIGDPVYADDHNNTVDFIERLEDTLGLNITGEEETLAARLDAMPTLPDVELSALLGGLI
jgi:hypothetical protein